jgi:glycosyltransferase involved in cell wall biosynthesis
MNISYLRAKFGPRRIQTVELLPIWGRISAPAPEPAERVRAEHGLPANARIVVFGGQITQGRGVEDVLAAAELALLRRRDLCFLVIGQGRLAGLVKTHIASGGGANVVYRERIPRADYLRLLAACDIGLVATVRNVDVPTFPSKIIDYLRAGLPIVASVEQSTDFGTLVEEQGLGIAVEAGNPPAILAAVEALVDDKARAAKAAAAGRTCLADVFDVRHAARRITASLSKTMMIRSADD